MLNNPIELEEQLVAKAAHYKIPLTANFELTPLCTMKCEMCFIQMDKAQCDKYGGVKTIDKWLNIATQLREMGCLFILLTGGEPFLYPNFELLYKKLRQMGFIITINTNGTLLTEDTIQCLIQEKPRRVNVTIYGGNPNTYESLCHYKDGFDRAIRALNLLHKYKIDTKINLSLVKKNSSDYDAIMELAQNLNMPVVVNSYMFPALRSLCKGKRDIVKERMSPQNAAMFDIAYLKYRYKEDFNRIIERRQKEIEENSLNEKGVGLDCRAGTSSCWINWQQWISPCVLMEHPSVDLSNLSVKEAWTTIVSECANLPIHKSCAGCKLRTICDVCYAAVNHEEESCGNLSYLCTMAKTKYELIKKH